MLDTGSKPIDLMGHQARPYLSRFLLLWILTIGGAAAGVIGAGLKQGLLAAWPILAGIIMGAGWLVFGLSLAALWKNHLNEPLRDLRVVAEGWAKGDMNARADETPGGEAGRLGSALNHIAEKLQKAIQASSQERLQLTTVLTNMIEAVVAVDGQGSIMAVNPALCRLFSTDSQFLIGRTFLEAIRHKPLNDLLQTALATLVPQSQEVRVFATEELVFEAHAVPLIENGRSLGGLLVLHDVTRLRRLEQVRRDFVANISHELRTPLASIKGFAETLRSGAIEDKENRLEFVQAIENHADRLAKLVNDLLDLAAAESNRQLKKEPLLLDQVASEVTKELRALALQKQVTIRVERPSQLPPILADRAQIKQVMMNLIDNGIKFNKPSGQVKITFGQDGKMIFFLVKDDGIGIPAQDLPRIFERFYRVDMARTSDMGGTGLGLAIVKHIVEAHGGQISAQSSVGSGSTFQIRLPIE